MPATPRTSGAKWRATTVTIDQQLGGTVCSEIGPIFNRVFVSGVTIIIGQSTVTCGSCLNGPTSCVDVRHRICLLS